jgi:hypothetical protein
VHDHNCKGHSHSEEDSNQKEKTDKNLKNDENDVKIE